MSAIECLDAVQAAAGRELTDEELDDIFSHLEDVKKSRAATNKLTTLEEDLLNAADEYGRNVVESAEIEARNALINIKVRHDLMSFADKVNTATGDPSLALEARMVGINNPIATGRQSVDSRTMSLHGQYMGGLIADLRKDNMLSLFDSRTLEREIAAELAEISKKNGNVGISGSGEALKIAHIMDKYRKAALARENRAGAWIKPLEGYITRQNHDPIRMRRDGFEKWRDTVLPLLDTKKSFEGGDIEKALRAAYDGLVTGNHLKAHGGAENDLKLAFKGSGNLAKRLSQSRVLHFKDSNAWIDYNEVYGRSSMSEAFISDLGRAAQNTALMETFGTNPKAMFDTVRDELKAKYRGDTKKFDRLDQQRLENQFKEVDGTTRIPGNPTGAMISGNIRSIQSMAKLGGAFLSSLSDIGFGVGERRYQGKSLLSSWGGTLSGVLEGMAPGDARRTADLIGVGLDMQLGDIGRRWNPDGGATGKIAKMEQLFWKLNLLGGWSDANKRATGLMMARDLAMDADKAYKDLPQARLLAQYGIDEKAWNIARQAVKEAEDGREYLTPDAIQDLPDSLFGSGRVARKGKDDLETNLRAYIVDRADFAVPTPGARERAILLQGTQPGTVTGEAIRFMAQFKAFPVTSLTKVIGREVYGHGATNLTEALFKGKGDMIGLAHMVLATTALGYLAMSAKDISKGRTPRDPMDKKTWVAAMLQGGGLGLYGDFLFGEFNRFGGGLIPSAAGPTAGAIEDFAGVWAALRDGKDFYSKLLRAGKSNAPFLNLFYTKAALDYLIVYQAQEMMNPGYLRRMERRVRKGNNQEFWLPPSQAVR